MEFDSWPKCVDAPHDVLNLCLSLTRTLAPASLIEEIDTVSTPDPKESHNRSLIGASRWLRGV